MLFLVARADENLEAVKKMILNNRRITIRELADDGGICQAIFMDVLGMKRAAAKIVSKLDIAQEMLTTFNDNPDLLKRFITRDKLWVYGYYNETKAQ